MGLLLADYKALEAHFLNDMYSHVGRKGNQVTHVLAKNKNMLQIVLVKFGSRKSRHSYSFYSWELLSNN